MLNILRGRERNIGFTVRRLLPTADFPMIGPFIFLDHMGPATFKPNTTEGDVRPHPHIGLATVTYLFSGAFMHRDSLGSVQRIEPGAVNWMLAGSGIAHSERIPMDVREQSTPVQGLQMWVALPLSWEESEPEFIHYGVNELPLQEFDGGRVRLMIGELDGKQSPVKTPSPTLFADIRLNKGVTRELQAPFTERAIYVVSGQLQMLNQVINKGELAVLGDNDPLTLKANEDCQLMLIGGEPLNEHRYIWWNFVSSRKERIEQAKSDWKAHRFVAIPNDDEERIPLPER